MEIKIKTDTFENTIHKIKLIMKVKFQQKRVGIYIKKRFIKMLLDIILNVVITSVTLIKKKQFFYSYMR